MCKDFAAQEQIQPTFALKKSSNVRANKTPCSRHAGNPAERNMDHPMHSNMYMMESDPIESYRCYALSADLRHRSITRLGKLPPPPPDFHTSSEDHAAWIINLQTGRLASGVSATHKRRS
jgi:hypothetical protein